MKFNYKIILIALIFCALIPQIAFASWWNPFSWSIWGRITQVFYKADNKTQVLENRVRELENKLSEQTAENAEGKVKNTQTENDNKNNPPVSKATNSSQQTNDQSSQIATPQIDTQTAQYKKILLDRSAKVYATAKARSDYAKNIVSLVEERINLLNSQISKNQTLIDSLSTPELKEAYSILNDSYKGDVRVCQSNKSLLVYGGETFNSIAQQVLSDANKISQTISLSENQYLEFDDIIKVSENNLPKFSGYQDKDIASFSSWVSSQGNYYSETLAKIKTINDYLTSNTSYTLPQPSYAPSSTINNLYIPQPKSIQCYFRWYGTSGSMECY